MDLGDKEKYSREHWEMVAWLQSHEASLDEKYDIKNIPRRNKKRKPAAKASKEPEDTLDLHGLTVEEAVREIKSFITGSKLKGYYFIKIIHGKGLHSQGEAKLKSLVVDFLNGEGRNLISSWKHASLNQGGDGAVIIYL